MSTYGEKNQFIFKIHNIHLDFPMTSCFLYPGKCGFGELPDFVMNA